MEVILNITFAVKAIFLTLVISVITNIILIILNWVSISDASKASRRLWTLQNAPHYYPIGIENKPITVTDKKFIYIKRPLRYQIEAKPVLGINIADFLIYEKTRFSYNELEKMVKTIISTLGEIKKTNNFISLIVETLIVETDGGYYYDTDDLGGLGIAQVNYKTAQLLLDELKKENPNLYHRVQSLKVENLTLRQNLIHNMAYNISLCCLYYHMRKGNSVHKLIKTKGDRASLWKEIYNTSLGKGTAEIYVQRVNSYSSN